ncbi:hypothetical protein AMTR_s00196p00023290 [Amborella trichopoda]|uniref:Uncharacterized protein n=1 Tax=Amborella trichopoda TaxID=13333 RepID=U5D9U5_AMBTC|nr:hypothetical protein AMTR_s00196p00023290 [Amborella trichopoda]
MGSFGPTLEVCTELFSLSSQEDTVVQNSISIKCPTLYVNLWPLLQRQHSESCYEYQHALLVCGLSKGSPVGETKTSDDKRRRIKEFQVVYPFSLKIRSIFHSLSQAYQQSHFLLLAEACKNLEDGHRQYLGLSSYCYLQQPNWLTVSDFFQDAWTLYNIYPPQGSNFGGLFFCSSSFLNGPRSYNRTGSILHCQMYLETFLNIHYAKASWTTNDESPRSICDRAEFTSYLPYTSVALYLPLVTGLQSKERLLTS